MTITLPLQPQEEAKLKALAHAKGLSAEALVRDALDGILAGASEIPDHALSEPATGAALVAALQASPYKEIDLEAVRSPLPTRNIVF
jgi:ferritin-like metal-binding protein YciE